MTALIKALEAKRARLNEDEKGFTLIELLVVVIIIGILAAIAIPIFLSQQDQAKDSAAKSDLGQAKIAYTSYLVENPSGTSTVVADALTPFGFVESPETGTVSIVTGGTGFCIQATRGSKTFSVTNTGGVDDVACTP